MEEGHGEGQVGTGVELQEGLWWMRLHGHGGPDHTVPKQETKGEYSGVPSKQCLFQPLGEPVRPCREMVLRSGMGGQFLPDCGPRAAGVGDSMYGVQGSQFLVLLSTLSPGGGAVPMGRIRFCTWWLLCGGRWGSSLRRILAMSMVRGPWNSLYALVVRLWASCFGSRACLYGQFGL